MLPKMVIFDGDVSGTRAHGRCNQIYTPLIVLEYGGVCGGILRADVADMTKLLNDGSHR